MKNLLYICTVKRQYFGGFFRKELIIRSKFQYNAEMAQLVERFIRNE